MSEQWTVAQHRGVWVGPVISAEGGRKGIAFVCGESDANARLIAAAPELLAAARLANQEMLDLGVGSSGSPALVALWAAIAKAEGRSE